MNKAIKTALALTAMLAAGCNEGTVTPRTQEPQSIFANGGGPTTALTQVDTLKFSFVIDPAQTLTYNLGSGNTITFPAGSLCDLSSSYGPSEWDKPCAVSTTSVTVNTRAWIDKRGKARVMFDKEIRFVPSVDPARWVMLTMTDPNTATLPWRWVLYCPGNGMNTASNKCVDEAVTDPTVATFRSLDGTLKRRIKHFSGYSIATGEPCDPSPDDPDCIADDGGFRSRSTTGARVSTGASVTALLRDHPLPAHPSKSATIGPLGGELRLPQAGVTLIVPAGAVSRPTEFSITHTNGRFLAYNFEPHGARFNVPLVLVQDLRGTNHKAGAAVIGGYFADDSQLNQSTGHAVVNELLSVSLNNSLNQATMLIWHFSGYMMASGRDE